MKNILYINGKKYYFNAIECVISLFPTSDMKGSK
jgi:hypothetical protein